MILACLLLVASNTSFSEDIELYISESVKQAKTRPQVLIIFDNSGSMSTTESVKASYDPTITYPAVGGLNSLSDKFIYFTKGGVDGASTPVPDSPSESRRFLDDINSCQTARDILDEFGYYTGQIREYDFQGNSGRWIEIPDNNGANIDVIDCEDDVLAKDNRNAGVLDNNGDAIALDPGYPVDGEGNKQNPQYHAADINDANVEWSGPRVTLYTDNYLRWHHNAEIANEIKSRLEIAQESVSNLVNSAPFVDFGLQVFNYNDGDGDSDSNGGRIVFGIQESTPASKTTLLDLINDDLDPETWTPLCETLYEASRYFAGKGVDFGDDDKSGNGYTANTPSRDTSIEESKVYKSPFTSCSDKAYVILITDGEPTFDRGADSKILAIPESGQDAMGTPFNLNGTDNYLAALAGWMNNNDVNTSLDGKQTVTTFTIGFALEDDEDEDTDTAEPLLIAAAEQGGGKYFPADDTATLTAALINVLESLEPSNDSLTSASVAANNFDRTETLNSVYYAMFQPGLGPRWQGNLKKYKVIGGVQQGKNGNAAIEESSGHFSEDVTSYWSSSKDGNKVAEGGVADMLRKADSRTLYSDIGGAQGATLKDFTLDELVSGSNVFGSLAALATELDVLEEDVAEHIQWAQGLDVDDENDNGDKTDMRYDVFGDPLHSKPLVINYGDKIHIMIGTNAGALHMFKDNDDTVSESWAFMPREFLSDIKSLRDNFTTADKVYGVDGRITSHIRDLNGDGIVNGSDTVWVFFGLRRGGTSYYAMDVTNPESPSLMWHIDASTSGFSDLGQSWSQPKIGYSKFNVSGDTAKPVVFFGGGYDINKDNSGPGDEDSVGRAIYMVDAETGALKWNMAKTNASTTFDGTDSIPSAISTLDSDGDGLVDRLYTGDTGGNLWRVDMPDDKAANVSVFKLANLGGDTNATDRRFFSEASVVRTFISETIKTTTVDSQGVESEVVVKQDKPYDAILLGSGDRSNPLGEDTQDIFFMIKDENIKTQTYTAEAEPKTPTAITISDLYDYTNDPFGSVSDEGRQALELAVSEKSGWYIDLTQSGEKSTETAIVINNIVYFTAFTPPELGVDVEGCELPNGKAWLYAVDLALGTAKYNWAAEDSKNRDDRIAYISEQFLGAPTLIVIPEDDGDDETIDEGVGNLIVGRKIIPVGFTLQTMRTYLYVTEEQ